MKRTAFKAFKLSHEQAAHAVSGLVSEGRIAAREVFAALRRREKLLRQLRARLEALEGSVGKDGPFPMGAAKRKRVARKVKRKARRRVSAARRAAMRTQGRYLAAVRPLSKAARAKIKAIRAESGVRAAIRAARSRLAEQRFITRQSRSPGKRRNQKHTGRRQGKASDQRRKKNGKRSSYPARPDSKPDKHGGSGAGRQQGGSGAGRERG